jgi:hypothetical protein
MPPTVEARFAHDTEQALRSTGRSRGPLRSGPSSPTMPEGPASEMRLAARLSLPPELTDEAWSRTLVGNPRVVMDCEELKQELHVDHRAGFVLSLMDGSLDLETLIDLSGMDRGAVLELVRGFYEAGIVVFR